EHQPGSLVIEVIQIGGDILAIGHATDEAQDLVQGSSSSAGPSHGVGLTGGTARKNRCTGKLVGAVLTYVSLYRPQPRLLPGGAGVLVPLDADHRDPQPACGYVQPSGAGEEIHHLEGLR